VRHIAGLFASAVRHNTVALPFAAPVRHVDVVFLDFSVVASSEYVDSTRVADSTVPDIVSVVLDSPLDA